MRVSLAARKFADQGKVQIAAGPCEQRRGSVDDVVGGLLVDHRMLDLVRTHVDRCAARVLEERDRAQAVRIEQM